MNRKDDADQKTRFRSERLFRSQDQWFCNTREGEVLGPFAQREDALAALREYLRKLGVKVPNDAWDKPGASS